MSFISRLLKGYQIDTPVTTKEYIENKTLQGNKTISSIKNKSEFIEDVDISSPQLWYMFNHTDKLKNYGVQQINYDTTTTITSNNITEKHIKYTGSGITQLNKYIIQDLQNDFTISFWCKGSGIVFNVHYSTTDYIKLVIGTNSISMNETSIGSVTLDITQYNHIVLTNQSVYVNNIKIGNITLPDYVFDSDNDIITLDSGIEYYDLRIFNKLLTDDKITKLYNLGNNSSTNSTIGDAGTYSNKISNFDINAIGENSISIVFWINSDNVNNDIINYGDLKIGIRGKRFYTETANKNNVFSNRKLTQESRYYFVCVVIENVGNSHILKLYIDNFPVIGKKFKDTFTFTDETAINGNNIENLLIYNRTLDDSEIMDLYIRDTKLNEIISANLTDLYSDFSKNIEDTDESLYNLQLHSEFGVSSSGNTGSTEETTTEETRTEETTTEETSVYDIYKFNKYSGYVGFKDDLYAWYKFEKSNTEPITSIATNMIDSSNCYLAFKHDGSTDNQTSYTVNFPEETECDILIVGGGGGGGGDNSGGGGAGGLIFVQNHTFNADTTYSILVGKGGIGDPAQTGASDGIDTKITDSTQDIFTAYGGGAGGTDQTGTSIAEGKNGGSGGGGSGSSHTTTGGTATQTGTNNYGNDGGNGSVILGQGSIGQGGGGGGGGAGGAGLNGSDPLGAIGGIGLANIGNIDFKTHFDLPTDNSIGEYIATEDKVYFAGGGGAGNDNATNPTGSGNTLSNRGGKGGGGNGGTGVYNSFTLVHKGQAGLPNSGGGGGGGTAANPSDWKDGGSAGGSGIVIIRYSSSAKTLENAIDSNTNQLQIPADSVITKTIGTFSPYSLYWDGDLNDNTDNSYLTSSLSNLTPPLSISFWKKQDKLVSEETLSITDKLSLSINSNLTVKFSVGSTSEIIENQADLDWHFWTITSDGTSNQLYRDGRVLGNVITESLTLSATDELMIGSNLSGQNDASPSYLEDLRIWKKSLTHQQIIDCMSIYPGYKNHANDLYLWYKFEDHPWNTSNIKDYSGDKRDGTITNYVSSGTFDDGYPIFPGHENNLVAWYKFDTDPTNGATLTNYGSGGSEYDATLNIASNGIERLPAENVGYKYHWKSDAVSGNYISIPPTILEELYLNGHTICFWAKDASTSDTDYTVVATNSTGDGSDVYIRIHTPWSNGNIYYDIGNGSGITDYSRLYGASGISANQLVFWTFTRENISSTQMILKIYKNGIQFLSNTMSRYDFNSSSSSSVFHIGYNTSGEFIFKNKSLEDFRIYDKALSPDEVKQIYGYTLSRQQGRISPYAYFFNGSTAVDADNAYITKDTITDFPSTFSIAFWKKCLDKSVEGKSFLLSTTSANIIEIDVSNTVNFTIGDSSNILEDYNDVSWHHWVFTYSGTEMDIYKDGMNRVGHMINKKTGLTPLNFTSVNHTIYVGGHSTGDASPSYLEDFRIYNKVLSGIQIQQIYSEWTGDIVDKKDNLKLWYQLNNNPVGISDYPSDRSKFDNGYVYNYANTSPYFDGVLKNILKNTNSLDGYPGYKDHENDLVAWYKFDGDLTDSSGNGNDLTESATIPFIISGLIDQSADFSSSDFLSTNSISFLNLTFTVSFWAKFNTAPTGTNQFFCSQGVENNPSKNFAIFYESSQNNVRFSFWGAGGHDMDTNGYNMTNFLGTDWHHYIFTYNDTTLAGEIWIDNQKLNTNINNFGGRFTGSGDFYIAKSGTYNLPFNGLMEDFRIYDKVLSDFEIKQIYSGYTVSREKGHVSPYSYYWNGSTTDNNDNAYIEAIGTATPMTDITDTNSFTISYYKKLEGTVAKSASLSPDFNILSGSTNRISVGVNSIIETFTYTSDSPGLTGKTQYSLTFAKDTVCDILIVGGGGGGGSGKSLSTVPGSGGGAGGLIFLQNQTIPADTYAIIVGKGGYKAENNTETGQNGFNSSFSYLQTEAIGGGGGGSTKGTAPNGVDGGSGGGGNVTSDAGTPGQGHISNIIKSDGTTIIEQNYRQGFEGGYQILNQYPYTGGGGGAGGRGKNDYENPDTTDGDGGIGKSGEGSIDFKTLFGITDTNIGEHHSDNKVYFAGGGACGKTSGNENTGGLGGGGDGHSDQLEKDGKPNTGGGGAGSIQGIASNGGGNGGSGIVIIRYSKQHIKLNDISYETNVSFDLNVWYRWTFTYDGTNAKIYMMNIGNTALTPISEELTPTFTGWTDETFDKVLIGGGKTNLTNGLIAHYKFDGDFTDSSGNGCNLTLTSGTVSTSATNVLIGSGSFESDDTLNYKLSLPTTIDLRNTDFTISIWFNINKRRADMNIIKFAGAVLTSTSYKFYTRDTGHRVRVTSYGPDGNSGDSRQYGSVTGSTSTVGYAFELNQWYLHTFTLTNTEIKEYLNGSLIETRTTNVSHYTDPFTEMYIGTNNTTENFSGYLDDFRIYNRALSATDVSILYNNSIPDVSPAYLEDIRMYNTSFTEEDVKNLSLYNIPTTATVSSGSGTVDLSGVGTGSYVLKLPEASYGGYKDHINDLIVWYKFEKTPNGELRNYGKDSTYYGIVNNSGIAKPELVFSDSSTTVDTKFRLLELENNKLDKIHILDTDLKYDGTGDSNITYTVTPTSNINVDILVVGGGGGGGLAGAGGADVEYIQNYELSAGTEYTFKVGKGGDIGNIGGPSEMTSNLTNLYKVLGGGNGGSLTVGSTITEVFEYGSNISTRSDDESGTLNDLSYDPGDGSTAYHGLYTWTKPEGVKEVIAYVWGAGGGGGYDKDTTRRAQDGGNGGFIYCKINVTSINNLYIYVGQGGVVAYRDTSSLSVDIKSFGGGGSAKTGYGDSATHAIGGGGGLSGIFEYDSSFSTDTTNNTIGESEIPIVIAGGGGGGGTYPSGTTYHGGDAGSELLDMTTGDSVWPGSDAIANEDKANYEGKGGGVSAVTTFAEGTIKIAGGKYYGGSDVTVNKYSSGGGSGYFGGSTGYHDSGGTIASSGGGSSYVRDLQTSNATNIYDNTIGNQPGSYGYMPGRKGIRIDASVADRSISSKLSEMTGGNGLIVLEYTPTKPSPPIASATSGGGLVLTDPLEYHSPLLALGKGFTGGNYYYESNLDGTVINYAGGGGGSASSGTNATVLGPGKGGAGLYYSITTINTEYGKGGNSFEGFKYPEVKILDSSTFVAPPDTILSSKSLTDMSGETMVGPFDINVDNKDYVIYTFKYNSAYDNTLGQTEYQFNLNEEVTADILTVGGGGGGGTNHGGGGGAGGVVYVVNAVLNKDNYKIKVGNGGNKGLVSGSGHVFYEAYNGYHSSIEYNTGIIELVSSYDSTSITTIGYGGGHGGAYGQVASGGESYETSGEDTFVRPSVGGSKGGKGGYHTSSDNNNYYSKSGYYFQSNTVWDKTSSTYIQGGNVGGEMILDYEAGGGGGAGSAGANAVSGTSGNGGNGVEIDIIGENVFYAAGGGGGTNSGTPGTGGNNIGGNGGTNTNSILATDGINHTGSGGGGGSYTSSTYSGAGGSGIVIIRFPKPSTLYTPPITSSLPATIIKPTSTKPTLVKNNINEVYYEFTAQETIQFIETISTTVFVTDGTDMIEETITFEPHKSYVIDPATSQITDSTTNIISALATGTTSTITGESLSYNNPTIIIRYSRLTTYEYGKGGDLNTTGNSGAIIIRYNYYDQTANPERVILQKPGYLNPYSYVWRGNATQPIDDSYISINNPANILNNQFLSINFWLERDLTTTSKDYIFAITEHNPYNELLGIGLDSSNLFVNILGSSHTTPITSTNTHCHYSVEIDYSGNTYAVYTTTIANEARLDTDTTVSTITLVASTSFIPTITFESSNLYSKEIKATIGDIFDDNIVDYELSPHGIEDFRIYNKTLTSVIADVAPANTTKYHTLFMSGYKASSATGVIANVNTDVNIDLEFYNLQPVNGGILKNIGNRTSEFNVLIHNNTYSNQDVITNKIIDAEATEVLQGKYGFEWNKIDTAVFEKNYYEGENIALEISDLKIISDYSISFDLTLKAYIATYPVEIINKNNELVVRMNDTTTIVVSYFLNKVKYFKEITINALVVDTKKSFDIVIDKDTNDISFKVDAGASIVANVVNDLKVWYQFEDDKTVKNYSKSSYSNLELNVESNIGFISSLSSDIDVDYTSPYSYYTFLQGDHSFKVENEIKCDMLMVGGGGMKLKRVSKTEVFEYTGTVETWTKPEGVKEVTAYVWGAGGGGSGFGFTQYNGGAGGFVKVAIDISNVAEFKIVVGEGGKSVSSNPSSTTPLVNRGGWGGGGVGMTSTGGQSNGSGGGLTGIFEVENFVLNQTTETYRKHDSASTTQTLTHYYVGSSSNPFIIVGGGGGGGNQDGSSIRAGGGGGNGTDFTDGNGKNGGQQTDAINGRGGEDNISSSKGDGLAYDGEDGSKYHGGDGAYWGAGGGAGYYGGGGGGTGTKDGGGGGGGSSYWGGTGVVYIADVGGANGSTTAPNVSDYSTYILQSGIAKGGATSGTIDGGNGLIVLEYECDVVDTLPSNILKSPGGGGGEVKLYNELILQPGDYTVTVGEGGYDTTLSSNSVVIYKSLSGNLNNGGKAELNSNANPDVAHGFEGGDGYYESNVDTGIEITYAGGGGGMGSVGEPATSTSGGKGGIGIYHSLNPYGISYEYGAGGNATPLQPNYGLYAVLPWNQHNVKDIKDIVSFKVWNQTTSKYELPTTDFVFDKELMDMSIIPNYTGLYTFADTDDEYYLYTFKYLDTIPVQTFEYKLTADGMTAYIFEKSNDRKAYIEGNNKDITIYVDDTVKFINNSDGHLLAIKDSADADIATESATITEYTFDTAGDYSYYCVSHPVMTGKITVIDKPTDNYDNSLGQTAYQLDIKRNVNADILIVGGGGAGGVANGGGGGGGGVLYATGIELNGNYIIKIGDGGKSAEPRGSSTYQSTNSTNGYSSIFEKSSDMIEVFGGGYGGNADNSGPTSTDGNTGGSGGGGSYTGGDGGIKRLPTYNTFITSTNSTYYGGIGGTSVGNIGGGGGGANGITPPNYNGANGIQINIDGNNYYYGGGGGGIHWANLAGSGGLGGGGGGGGSTDNGGTGGTGGRTNGKDGSGSGADDAPTGIGGNGGSGTGGGGGGDAYNSTTKGGNGGSGIVIIRFSKSNIENVLTNFGRGANAGQHATPGLLVLKTDNNQILTTETTKHPKLPYSYVWSGKTDTATDQVLVKSTEDFTIPTNLTLTFWYYESVNDDEKIEIIKITDELKVSSTTTDLVFTVGDSNVNIPRPNKYEWNFYGLIFNGTDANVYVYVNDILVKTETVTTVPTGSGKITLGISTSGIAKIADYRIYESIDVLNITEQYSSLGNVGILDVFGNHLTEYDVKENKVGKGYLSLNQNNVKTKIFNNEDIVIISYKFKGIEADKYYPIIQFTDYINGIIVPKVEITMKINKLFVSVIIDNSIIEKEYVIDCTNLKSYSITINTDKTIVVSEDGSVLPHTPVELIGLYSFENNDTTNDQIIENLVGETILSNMTICNIELSTKVISGTTNESNTEIITDDQIYHYYEIKESGSMTFAKETRVDMVLVGGGAGGGASNVGTEYYGEHGEVNVISTYLEGTYQIEIGSGGESNMPGTKSTIVDTNTGLVIYSADGGLSNIKYIDSIYSNLYTSYDFGNGEKKFGGYGINSVTPPTTVTVSPSLIYDVTRLYPSAYARERFSKLDGESPDQYTISGSPYGDGTYIIKYSSYYNEGTANTIAYGPQNMFFKPDPETSESKDGNFDQDQYDASGTSTSGNYTGIKSLTTGTSGDWISIQMPDPILLTSYLFIMPEYAASAYQARAPMRYKLYGCNDGDTNWELIYTETLTTSSYTNTYVNANDSYKKDLLSSDRTRGDKIFNTFAFSFETNGGFGQVALAEIELFGKEVLVNVNIEPQLIYNNITRYPATASTSAAVVGSDYSEAEWNDGSYNVRAKASELLDNLYGVWELFNHIISGEADTYHTNQVYSANTATAEYTGSSSFKGNSGVYITIDLGREIYPFVLNIAPRDNSDYPGIDFTKNAPGLFKVYGSNDSYSYNNNSHPSWTLILDQTIKKTYTNQTYTTYDLDHTNKYRYFAIVVTHLTGTTAINYGYLLIGEIYFNGTETIVPNYKTLTFTFTPLPDLVYDFTPYNDLASWEAYAISIGATPVLDKYEHGGVFAYSDSGYGSISLPMPTNYDTVSVVFGNVWDVDPVILYVDNAEKERCDPGETKTYTQTYTGSPVLKIEEGLHAIIDDDLIITFSKTQNSYDLTFDNPAECEILIVGGGGGGGAVDAGGGGAGGLIYETDLIMNGTYNIKVGNGGTGGLGVSPISGEPGNKGYNSQILSSDGSFDYEAIGGGGGGQGHPSDTEPTPAGGGSSGGLGSGDTSRDPLNVHIPNQGNAGGTGAGTYGGGGGGGAGQAGGNADGIYAGVGGNGRQIDITGINTYYAGGGGGGFSKVGSVWVDRAGGLGGGGVGKGSGTGVNVIQHGENGRGGGGGGGGSGWGSGGNGGSGIVIIRYKTTTEQEPDILYPGTGGKTELPGTAGILALREYRSSEQQYSISRTTGYNLPYSYQWSGITNEHSDKNYLYSIVNSTSFLNTDFIIGFWCYLNNIENISLLSIPDVLKIYISNQTLIFELSDGKATSLIKRNEKWQHLTFVRSNNSLEIYIDNVNKSKLLTKVSVDIVDSSTTLYINKSTTIIDNFIDPIKISDLRIYNNSSKYIIDKLANLPKEQYCYIGANQITDIAPSVLSEFKVNNPSTTALTDTTITYHPVTLSSISGGSGTTEETEITINTIIGNESLIAYEWSNLEQSESFKLSNLYMSINNGKDLINKCYTGFEFSVTYWCKFGSSCNIYELQLLSTEHKILELKHNVDNLLELSFDITTDSNQSITTILDQTLLQDHWYLIGITAGISDKYVSLSLGIYDTTFDGSQGSYISSSILVPLIDNYNYNINNYTNELKINAVEYGDVSYYNRFITLVDIYNILTDNPPNAESLTLTESTATINLINSSTISTDPISFNMILDGTIYTLTGTDSLDNVFNAIQSSDSSPQTIKIIKGTKLTLNITTTTSHPFIIVESKVHQENDTNKYTTGVTYSSDSSEYETGKGQIGGNIIWDTTNSSLGTYYGICINHSEMYFIIELVTGIDKTINTTTNESIIGIDINKYYKMNMSFSFSKNDLELSQNVSDFVIRSESKTYLKFSAKDHPILNLYSNLGLEQEITTTHTALNSNVWYDYYVTLNYDGTNTTGGIYIGKDKQIDYFTNYTITDFTPFKDIGLEYDTLEVRIGINKDEQPVKLNKKIENINIYTKKLNHSTINNLIRNNAISIIPSTTIESNKLELWYRLNDFTNNEFNNEIKDSSGKNKNGSATGTNPTQVITNINSKIKSNKLLKNNFKAMKITDHTFNISTPKIILNNNFTIMIKSKLEIDASEHNIFTYNDLSVDISNTELKVIYGSTTKTITYTFEEKWYAITLMYNKNKTQLSIYINEELKGKYNSVDITSSTNILKLSDYSSKTPPTNIKLSLEDLRILSNEVKYETIYEYANGINVLV